MQTIIPFDLDRVTAGYLECAAWADKPEGSNPRFSKSETANARKVCAAFLQVCGPLALQAASVYGYSAERFGNDFWLTRCGHGTGFWDREELEIEACEVLTLADRDNKPYLSNDRIDTSYQLGDALSCAAYGSANAIGPFAYPSLDAYRGWLTIEGSAEHAMRDGFTVWPFWREFKLQSVGA